MTSLSPSCVVKALSLLQLLVVGIFVSIMGTAEQPEQFSKTSAESLFFTRHLHKAQAGSCHF